MTGEEKVWVAEGSLGLVRAVRATYFFARITAFFTGDAVGCQKTVMLFSRDVALERLVEGVCVPKHLIHIPHIIPQRVRFP